MDQRNADPLVSIVIPVYNTPKKYFKECISSVASQTYQALEILIIDDGSEKEFADYCDELIKAYPERQAVVFHRVNAGVSASRNFGIDKANGEYLIFVDSDDIVGKYYVESLVALITKYHTNIAKCGFMRFTDESQLKDKDAKPSGKMYYQENEEIFKGYYSSYLWDKIFRKTIFDTFRFSEDITMCEDVLMISKLLNQYPACPAVAEAMYFYRINPHSLTETPNTTKCGQAIQVYDTVKKIPFIQNNSEMLADRTIHGCRWQLRYLMALLNEKPEHWREDFSKMRRKYLDDILPVRRYTDTKFMKISIPVIRISETAAIAYLSVLRFAKRLRNR